MKLLKKITRFILIFFSALLLIYFVFFSRTYPPNNLLHSYTIGDSLDSYNGVTVFNNGVDFPKSHGKSYSHDSGYYFGKKWQCVEFVKRYYFLRLGHRMPDVYGHAKDFFDKKVAHGKVNKKRALVQYANGGDEKPQPGDLLVFDGSYGHVAIVTRVGHDKVEVIQQNIFMRPRQSFPLTAGSNSWTIGEDKKPLGWLRKKD